MPTRLNTMVRRIAGCPSAVCKCLLCTGGDRVVSRRAPATGRSPCRERRIGRPLEWTEIIIIFMPLFWPIAARYHVDPILLGILVAVNLQTAFLSPPVAMAAFYIKGVAPKEVLLSEIWWGMMPFMGLQVLALVLVFFLPQLALWLPNLVFGR